ncbi:amino acid ABC transporter substrate-binding protein [Belliella marina]|uniref:Amino acid ABC transporter substrate-binding protein n=1 Tax=Belliella marina TaxID=1644146 RepID=A0ABW4VRH7_9BACT
MKSSKIISNPIRIGYSLSLFGPVAENTKAVMLAHSIWEEDINNKGGLLGRKVELVCYNDNGDPLQVADCYEKLLDEDKVDLVIGGYGTNTIAASMPVIMERRRFLVGLMGLGVNLNLKYPNYFSMIPTGPKPNSSLTEGFFALAASQNPKPLTVAILSADAEFSKNPVIGARENAEKYGFQIVYENIYSLSTKDFTSFIDQVQSTNADLLFICSYLNDSIGLIRTIHKNGYRPKMVGGAMIGPQSASVKTELGPLLNGFVNYEYWMPVPKMDFQGVADMLVKYQEKAVKANLDALGYYMAPLAYAQLQVLEQAVVATESLDDETLSEYCRKNDFETVIGNVRFDEGGEWTKPRVLQVQFQNIDNHDIETFRDNRVQVVVEPSAYASGSLIYPYSP